MKYVRMVVWMLVLVALVAFSVANWRPVEVKIWDGLILETKIPALVVVSFLLGLVPMWLVHRGVLRIPALHLCASGVAVGLHDAPC